MNEKENISNVKLEQSKKEMEKSKKILNAIYEKKIDKFVKKEI